MVLEELSFKGMRPHNTKWTHPKLGEKSLATSDFLNLYKEEGRIKELIFT